MYYKAIFISICNSFRIYLSVRNSKILSLMKILAILEIKHLHAFFTSNACSQLSLSVA